MVDDAKKPRKLPTGLCISACLAAAILGLGACWWGILRHEQAVRQAALRQRQIAKSLGVLRRTYPSRVFAACGRDGTPTAFQANFHDAGVRSVTLSPSDDGMTASVGLVGIKQENQAPTIYVALYDERGAVLARNPIVNFTFALLVFGDRQEVKDMMTLPKDAEPAIVSVDDPKQNKTPWGSDK